MKNYITLWCGEDPRGVYAGDSFDVVVSINNPAGSPVHYVSPRSCLVERTTVYEYVAYWYDSLKAPPVALVGSGDPGCDRSPTSFTIDSGAHEAARVPMVAWRDDDSARAGLADGALFPGTYVIHVDLTLPGRTAETLMGQWRSGYYEGFGPCTHSAESGPDTTYVVIQPGIVRAGWGTRVRYEMHNPTATPFRFWVCEPNVSTAADRWTGGGWSLGDFPYLCLTRSSGYYPVPAGGCVRAVTYLDWYAEGTYRLRVKGIADAGWITSDSFAVPPYVP